METETETDIEAETWDMLDRYRDEKRDKETHG